MDLEAVAGGGTWHRAARVAALATVSVLLVPPAASGHARCDPIPDQPRHAQATSLDGQWTLAAHGEQLTLLDRQGCAVKTYEGSDLARRRRGQASALFVLPQRQSFVVAWPTLGELWEISLDPQAPPVFDGWVHDHRLGEGLATPGYLGVRRTLLGLPMPTIDFADARVPWLAGALGDEVIVVHLDVRRRIAALNVPGARPHAAQLQRTDGRLEWWLPAGQELLVFDTARWTLLARHALPPHPP